jgi:tetratricopeptide (TPR) repeat protein
MPNRLARLAALIVALAMPPVAFADDPDNAEAAKAAYDEAQTLKRSNRFEEARQAFQSASELGGPDPSGWAALAADELRYGLPLQEAGALTAQLTQLKDFPSRQQALARIDGLYRTMLTDNIAKPERIAEIERRRDQLALARQALKNSEETSTSLNLEQLRERVETYRANTGQWPDRRYLEQNLSQTLRQTGIAADRMVLIDYYPSRETLYVLIRDNTNGSDIKLKGDSRGVRLERF